MKNKKIKLLTLSAVLLLAGGAFVANNYNSHNETKIVEAADAVTISTAEEFISCFDGSAKYYNRDIVLTADLDLEGHEFTGNVNMAGEFFGSFDGQGHTVSNFSANCLFNIIGSSGSVKNLNLIGTKYGNVSGFGFLCYQNNGTIENCFVSVTVNTACNTYGAFALMNNGTISNSASYMSVANSGGNSFYSFARDAGTINACFYNTDSTALVAATGTAQLDTNITAVSRGNSDIEVIKLDAPANATIVDNVLTFNSVENASSYQIEYRDTNGNVKAKENVVSGQTLTATLANGVYSVYIKTIGNSIEYLDSNFVQVTGDYVVTNVVAQPIKIDDTQTKIDGAGVAVYFADKPAITLNDINVELVSFYWPQDPNTKNSIDSKVEYIPSTGRFYFKLQAGYLDSHNVECTFNISYVYNGVYYSQEVSFVSNKYVSNSVKAAINWQYDNDDEPTAIRFIGTVENVALEELEKVEFVFALDGEERTVEVNSLYTSIAGLNGFEEKENKYYAVYILKGLDAKDNEGNYKYKNRSFTADIKVTLADETTLTAKEAKSFILGSSANKFKLKEVSEETNLNFGEEANLSDDTVVYWNDQNWVGSNVTVHSAKQVNGVLTFDYEYTPESTTDWGFQVFYKSKELVDGKSYTLKLTITTEDAIKVKVNGTYINLTNDKSNEIEVTYTERTGAASLSIQFDKSEDCRNLVELSNITWTLNE